MACYEVCCYFYSGALVGNVLKGGVRDISVFDGSITVDINTSVDDVIQNIKLRHAPNNPMLAHIRTLNKL